MILKLLWFYCRNIVNGFGTPRKSPVRDNYNPKSHKYVCITTYQPDTKSNPNPNPNPNPTTKQQAIVNIQQNIVACPTFPEIEIHMRHVAAQCVRL